MKDWKRLAEASGLDIPADQLERVSAALEPLEAAFRRALERVPHETEPAVGFGFPAEESQ